MLCISYNGGKYNLVVHVKKDIFTILTNFNFHRGATLMHATGYKFKYMNVFKTNVWYPVKKNYDHSKQLYILEGPTKNNEFTHSTLPSFFASFTTLLEIFASLALFIAAKLIYERCELLPATIYFICIYISAIVLTSLVLLPYFWKLFAGHKYLSARYIYLTRNRIAAFCIYIIAPIQLCLAVANPSLSIITVFYIYPWMTLHYLNRSNTVSPVILAKVVDLLYIVTIPVSLLFVTIIFTGFSSLEAVLWELLYMHDAFGSPIPLLLFFLFTSCSISSIFIKYLKPWMPDKKSQS